MNHILIAEDEHLIARLIELTLTRAGYHCTVAEDGTTAADLIEKQSFDLALLDIMLPGADGYELLEYLKPQGVPVIFITAKAAVKDRVQGLRLARMTTSSSPLRSRSWWRGPKPCCAAPAAAGGSCAPLMWCWTRRSARPAKTAG